MPRKSKSLNKGSDAELRAYLFHDSGQKLFGGTSGEQDLGDSSDVHQNQEFSIDSEEFPSLPGSEASPGIGNRNAVQDLAVPQNLGNATSGSNQATNSGPGNLSVQGQNQPSSSVLQQGSSSGEPISQSHVPIVNSPNSKGWFYDKSSNTKFLGSLDDYFPSADPPDKFLRLQEQQVTFQIPFQQGQQQVPAVSTGGSSSSVNTKGAGVLQASDSSGYRNAVSKNAGPQISRSISSDVQEQNQLASGVLQQDSVIVTMGPISQSQVQDVNSPSEPNESFLPNLRDDATSASSPERVRKQQGQPDSLQKEGLEATSDVQQNQEFNIQDENLPGFTGNADNLRGKEKVKENTMPTMPPPHTTMSRTVGFSSGESSSSHPQTNAVSAVGSNDEQPRNRLLDYNLSDPLQRESCSSHQPGQEQFPAVGTGGTSSSVNSQELLQNTIGAGGSIPGILPTSTASGNQSGLENAGPRATNSEGNMSRSIRSGGESSVQEHNQRMIGVLQQGSSALSQVQAGNGPDSLQKDDQQDENLAGNSTKLRGKEKVQEDTMPAMPHQHPPMSRAVGFSSGESCPSHRPQANAVSAVGSNHAGLQNLILNRLVGLLQEENRTLREEDLFGTIYCGLYEEARVYAEDELYNRGWVYHEGLKSWLLKIPNVPLSDKTQTHEKGSYIRFDSDSKRSVRMNDFIVEYKMLKERPALP